MTKGIFLLYVDHRL